MIFTICAMILILKDKMSVQSEAAFVMAIGAITELQLEIRVIAQILTK